MIVAELTNDWDTDELIVEELTADEGRLKRIAATLRDGPSVKVGEPRLRRHVPPPVSLGTHVHPAQVGVLSHTTKHCV